MKSAQLTAKFLFAVVALGVFLRVAGLWFVFTAGNEAALIYGDAIGYIDLALNLWAERSFGVYQNGVFTLEVFRTPGLPFLLMPFAHTNTLWLFSFIQAIVAGILMPLLTWAVGRRMMGDASGVVAATLVAVEPNLIFFSWLPLTETLFILCGMGSIFLLLLYQEKGNILFSLIGGALIGYAILLKPGAWPIFVVVTFAVAMYLLFKWAGRGLLPLVVFTCAALLFVVPWMVRVQGITGVYALSGSGWRNVYTDYLASVYALENGTMFWDEKARLKDETALHVFGLTRFELNRPEHSEKLRDYALDELWNHKITVLKLESMLVATFLTNDSYFSYFSRFGFLEEISGRISPSYVLLTEGLKGVPKIIDEMRRQWFLPILGRLFMALLIVGAVLGVIVGFKNPWVWFIVLVLGLWTITSTVIGLGVEARLRLPVQPLIFLLFGAGVSYLRERGKMIFQKQM